MSGGALFSFLDAEDVTVEGRDVRAPVVDHVVRVNGQARPFEAAIWPEEPGDICLQVCIDSTAVEMEVVFHEFGVVFLPELQRLGADFGSIGVKRPAAELDGDISTQGIAACVGIVTAVVSGHNRFVMSLKDAVGRIYVDGLPCTGSQRVKTEEGCRQQQDMVSPHGETSLDLAFFSYILP